MTTTEANIALWENVHLSRSWGRYPPEELVRFVGRNFFKVPDRKSIRFCEMGAGQGANLWFLAREGFDVAGIDGSASAVQKSHARFDQEGLDPVDLRVGNFAQLPWPDQTFDVVIDIESIYANKMSVIRSSLAEAYRTLKPQGIFFAKMFGIETSGYGSGLQLEPGTSQNLTEGPFKDTGMVHFFSHEELVALFSSWSDLKLEWTLRSDPSGESKIFEWVVQARK
jgi:ubiquinone/menaquinone biosynthesis C-methylase UbiE